MRFYRPGDLSITRILAVYCVVGMALVGILLLGQSTAFSAPSQDPSAGPGVAPPTDPAPSNLSPVETLPSRPPDPLAARERVLEALLKDNFSYLQNKMVDPMVPFISPVESAPPQLPAGEEDVELAPEAQRPLTPLQKMNLGEIEKGLKAITWGELGRRALVEDSAGKGYIVSVGTPAGERNGVITDIFNDRIVIQQQLWDRAAKRMMPQNFVVKLKKEQPK